MKFTLHTKKTAPEASRPILDQTEKNHGFIPNIHGILAQTPLDAPFEAHSWSRKG